MDNNAHLEDFPERLKGRRQALELSQKQLSDYTGLSLKTIQKYEYGDLPRGRNLIRLARSLNCSTDWLLLGAVFKSYNSDNDRISHHIDHIELIYLPHFLPRLTSENDSFEKSQENNKYAFRRDWLEQKGDPSQMVLMEVSGDSMSPEIKDGDTVLLDQSKREIFIGKIYAVSIGQEIMVRYVDRDPDKIILRSTNHRWKDIETWIHAHSSEPVSILGRVILVVSGC